MPSLLKAYSSKLRMAVLMVRGGGRTVMPMLMALLLLESRTMISWRFPSAAVFWDQIYKQIVRDIHSNCTLNGQDIKVFWLACIQEVKLYSDKMHYKTKQTNAHSLWLCSVNLYSNNVKRLTHMHHRKIFSRKIFVIFNTRSQFICFEGQYFVVKMCHLKF